MPRLGRFLALVLMLLLAPLDGAHAQPVLRDVAAFADPFIGTAPAPTASYGLEFDSGDVFPGAAYPAGMLEWSPDTVEHRIPGGYYYPDRTLKGFSLTHFSGRGCTVYQDVPILPVAGDPATVGAPNVTTFSHSNEQAEPGYYAVTLDNGTNVQLTVTPRTGLGEITFPGGVSEGSVLIDTGGSVNGVFDSQLSIDASRQLATGWVESQVGCGTDRYRLYFAIAFDHPFVGVTHCHPEGGTHSLRSGRGDGSASPGVCARVADPSQAQADISGNSYLTFDLSNGPTLRLKPAISYVSIENALANLESENAGWDITAVRSAARAAWNDVLNRIEVDGGSDSDVRVFYTALYHAFFHPNLFSDDNGEYIGFDERVHSVGPGHAHYHDIPGWDQYRSLIQLRALLAPDQTSDILQSLVDDATQGGGGMPRWEQANRNSAGMVGDSPAIYIANGYAFGARDFDAQAALISLDLGASVPSTLSGGHLVREYLEPWARLGYVPGQPSITLEYAADDFALSQFAAALGNSDRAGFYAARAANWVNTFDPVSGFVESRDDAGLFANDAASHTSRCCGFVEGNAAQYTWMVPFDADRLIGLLGGNAAAASRLDDFFSEVNAGPDRPYAWIGNEPSLSAPWAYDFAGIPSRTQSVVRRIQQSLFRDTPAGLPGNDDGGTISAWYVFSALGLYPVVPGVGGFAVGSPLFAEARVHLTDGHVLRIVGRGAADDAPYVQSLTLNGVACTQPWIDWSRLANGATLDFTLGSAPSDWGT